MALKGLFYNFFQKAIFHFTTTQREEYWKRGSLAKLNIALFLNYITHLWANSFQYCLTSNFEWLEWRCFSFLSFNLLFQFCKWDRYWLWRSSCREVVIILLWVKMPSSCLPRIWKKYDLIFSFAAATLKMLVKDYYAAVGYINHSRVYWSSTLSERKK